MLNCDEAVHPFPIDALVETAFTPDHSTDGTITQSENDRLWRLQIDTRWARSSLDANSNASALSNEHATTTWAYMYQTRPPNWRLEPPKSALFACCLGVGLERPFDS